MNDSHIETLAQVRQFLGGVAATATQGYSDGSISDWLEVIQACQMSDER